MADKFTIESISKTAPWGTAAYSAGFYNGLIYIYTVSNGKPNVYTYNPNTDEYATYDINATSASFGTGPAYYNGAFYLASPQSFSSGSYGRLYRYDIAAKTVTTADIIYGQHYTDTPTYIYDGVIYVKTWSTSLSANFGDLYSYDVNTLKQLGDNSVYGAFIAPIVAQSVDGFFANFWDKSNAKRTSKYGYMTTSSTPNQIAAFPKNIDRYAMFEYNGYYYICGGREYTTSGTYNTLQTIYAVNKLTNVVETLTQTFPNTFYNKQAVCINNVAYIFNSSEIYKLTFAPPAPDPTKKITVNVRKQNALLKTYNTYCDANILLSLKLQEKSLSPSTSAQDVTPDTGNCGISKVTVEAVTASIDSNIKASNIKKGVSILGVTGSYEEVLPTLNKPVLSISKDILTITDENGNFAKYNIYKDGTLLTATTSKTVDLSTYITSAGTYSITAKATGEHFNDSALSDAVSYTPTFKLVVSYANSTESTGTLVSVTPTTLTFDNTKTAQNFTVTTGKSDLLYISNNDEYVVGEVTSTVSGDNKIYTVPITPADGLIGTVNTTMTLKVVAGFNAVVNYEVLPASTATLNSITPTSLTYNSKTETHSFVIKVNENVSVSFNTGEYLDIEPSDITSETSGGIKTLTVPITLNQNNIGSLTSVTATLGLLLNLPQLSAPTGLTIDGTTLSWDAVENAESYDVYADDTVLLGNTTGGAVSTVTLEAGTYKFVDSPVKPSRMIQVDLSFISNRTSFARIVVGLIDFNNGIYYRNVGEEAVSVKAYNWTSWTTNYQTITLYTRQTVSAEFYNWAITDGNLVKNNDHNGATN